MNARSANGQFASSKERRVFYFGAGDPSQSRQDHADEGGISVIRAVHISNESDTAWLPSDFQLQFIYARTIVTADVRQWAGIIHDLHDRFGFSNFVLDNGAGGAGPAIQTILTKRRQLINGIECDKIPIITRDEEGAFEGHRILTMFRRKDPNIEALWPTMAGDDVLVHNMHQEAMTIFNRGLITWPKPDTQWEREALIAITRGTERRLAFHAIQKTIAQLQAIYFKVDANGVAMNTSHGVLSFASSTRKDMAYSLLYAIVGFLTWLKQRELEGDDVIDESNAVGFSA